MAKTYPEPPSSPCRLSLLLPCGSGPNVSGTVLPEGSVAVSFKRASFDVGGCELTSYGSPVLREVHPVHAGRPRGDGESLQARAGDEEHRADSIREDGVKRQDTGAADDERRDDERRRQCCLGSMGRTTS